MDGLSVASGIAGIVSVADIVVRTLIKYLSEVKDAKRDISALLTETSNLNGILRSLELLARQFQDEEVPATVQTHHLHHCHMTLERLRGLLEHAYPSKHESSLRALRGGLDGQSQNQKRRSLWMSFKDIRRRLI
jgi:hypothetical protein